MTAEKMTYLDLDHDGVPDAVERSRLVGVDTTGDGHQDAAYVTILEPFVALNLALEEILVNVIAHGYQGSADHQIIVRLALDDGEVRAEVEDDARPFNPLEAPEPDLSKPLEERPIGGLGIHLTRKMMDGLVYRRQGDKNLLVMRKKVVA